MLDSSKRVEQPRQTAGTAKSYKDFLSKEEISWLRKPNDVKAVWMFVFNWLVIGLCFAAIAYADSNLATIVALFVMAGRQLGIGILLHECSHRSFFSKPQWNQFMGHWFGGMPLLVPMDFYRPYHMLHHSKTGMDVDPDVHNIKQYPVSKFSMVRKVVRDFLGLSGLKILVGVLFYILPNREGNTVSMGAAKANKQKQGASNFKVALVNITHAIIFHSLFFACFWLVNEPLLYVYWWVCFVFVYPFILRMRQIAEHGAMIKLSSDDVRDTTRTTIARWWERLLFAPNYVNYHCEHHYLPTVPSYNLKDMHELMKQKGFYQDKPDALASQGYLQVLNLALTGKRTVTNA